MQQPQPPTLSARETIQTWKWRIVKAGHSQKSFLALDGVNIAQSLFSDYLNGKKDPSIERFDLIENKLKSLGV